MGGNYIAHSRKTPERGLNGRLRHIRLLLFDSLPFGSAVGVVMRIDLRGGEFYK